MSRILIFLIYIYKKVFSRFTPKCIYKPSCSSYAVLAIKKYGVTKGMKMSLNRINRCDMAHVHLYDTEDYP